MLWFFVILGRFKMIELDVYLLNIGLFGFIFAFVWISRYMWILDVDVWLIGFLSYNYIIWVDRYLTDFIWLIWVYEYLVGMWLRCLLYYPDSCLLMLGFLDIFWIDVFSLYVVINSKEERLLEWILNVFQRRIFLSCLGIWLSGWNLY